jgi:2-hydroxy-3-keto-5-methylthiopentenyl-1-phosphate phosphatase
MEFFTTIQNDNSQDGMSWEIATVLSFSRNEKFAIAESGCRVSSHQQNVDEVQQVLSGITFIDSGLHDYQSLVAGVTAGIEVIVIDSTQDGVEQITQALAQRHRISRVHIVSHGAPGAIYIGNRELSLETLNQYGNELLSWAEMLAPNAELLIYGCEVAKGDRGQAFIHRLSAKSCLH